MARFGKGRKMTQSRRKALYARLKGRGNAKRKYLLPRRGLNQTSYESGFFDFLDVFWNNSRGMNIYNLTKQVAKVWDALLPRPKLNKKTVLRDYYEEYKAIQEAAEKQKKAQVESEKVKQESAGKEEEMNRDMMKRQENTKKGNESGTEVESKSDFDEDSETDARSSRSRSDIESRTDDGEDSISGTSGRSEGDELSRSESEGEPRRTRPKRTGRKYDSYDAYLRAKGIEQKNKDNKSGEKQQSTSNQNKDSSQSSKGAQEGVFFPVRTETSFDRIVQADLDNQTELLKKLKICKPCSDVAYDRKPLNIEDMKSVESDNSLDIHSHLPPPPEDRAPSTFMIPTNILHAKNLIPGIQPHDLEEIFAIFLNDIVMFQILENKYRGEAVIECKSVEAAGNIWKQLNGIPYKRLPLVLEFANKEDLIE